MSESENLDTSITTLTDKRNYKQHTLHVANLRKNNLLTKSGNIFI
jgi:hypothetical protein